MIPNLVSAASILLLCFSLEACGAPTDTLPPAGLNNVKIPLRMRSPTSHLDVTERGLLAKRQRDAAIAKYSGEPNRRRSSGYNLIVDQDYDSGYYGSLAIGTPLTSFNVILDTGSSDLWVLGSSCSGSSCSNLPEFNPSSSSTFKNISTPFDIQYGQGAAAGYIGQDVVEMAGFTVDNQGFSVVDELSTNLLSSPVSGIMGLAWDAISASQQTPFWQTLASSGAMDSALFAFQLRRYLNASNANLLEPGGELTFGYTNTSLYTGSIEYINIPGTPSYWYLALSSLTVQGAAISLGSDTMAAIDTGTTNVGGPSSIIQAIYAQIPGSSAATGQWLGYYQYPCSTSVTVEISFGGSNWTMSAADFAYTTISSSQCIGAFFDISSTSTVAGSSSTSPSWIFGDSFLKNVYSVFRYNPPSIGFAALSEVAIAGNGVNGAVPSPTIGTSSATVTNQSNSATPRFRHGLVLGAVCVLLSISLLVL